GGGDRTLRLRPWGAHRQLLLARLRALQRRPGEKLLVFRQNLDLALLPHLPDVVLVARAELLLAHRLRDGVLDLVVGLDLAVRLSHQPDEDRKSTRLNSSHLGISYAVFCLKKKT